MNRYGIRSVEGPKGGCGQRIVKTRKDIRRKRPNQTFKLIILSFKTSRPSKNQYLTTEIKLKSQIAAFGFDIFVAFFCHIFPTKRTTLKRRDHLQRCPMALLASFHRERDVVSECFVFGTATLGSVKVIGKSPRKSSGRHELQFLVKLWGLCGYFGRRSAPGTGANPQ